MCVQKCIELIDSKGCFYLFLCWFLFLCSVLFNISEIQYSQSLGYEFTSTIVYLSYKEFLFITQHCPQRFNMEIKLIFIYENNGQVL